MPRCSQPKCRIAETGVCVEGHKQGCPNILLDELVTDSMPEHDGVVPPPIKAAPEPRHFHSGEKLNMSEASQVLNERPARVVLCVGSQRSGKTTFLARLGEMFRDGSFPRFGFAGSLTLCGFERASWLATITSGAGEVSTGSNHLGFRTVRTPGPAGPRHRFRREGAGRAPERGAGRSRRGGSLGGGGLRAGVDVHVGPQRARPGVGLARGSGGVDGQVAVTTHVVALPAALDPLAARS